MASLQGKKEFLDIEDLEKGDIIEFERARGLYFHCGIYDGKEGVIHRAPDPSGIESNKAGIRKDDLRLVAGSSPVYRTNMFDHVIRRRSGQEILNWAEENIGKKGYNLFLENCHHFCTEGRYGTPINMLGEKILGLRTGFSYNQNRVLVNTVKLPEMSRSISAGKQIETNKSFSDEEVRLSKKGLIILISAFAIKPFVHGLIEYPKKITRRPHSNRITSADLSQNNTKLYSCIPHVTEINNVSFVCSSDLLQTYTHIKDFPFVRVQDLENNFKKLTFRRQQSIEIKDIPFEFDELNFQQVFEDIKYRRQQNMGVCDHLNLVVPTFNDEINDIPYVCGDIHVDESSETRFEQELIELTRNINQFENYDTMNYIGGMPEYATGSIGISNCSSTYTGCAIL